VSGSPAITFAIPYYSGVDYLQRAIATVQAQIRDDWECVVVDDAGPESAAAAVLRAPTCLKTCTGGMHAPELCAHPAAALPHPLPPLALPPPPLPSPPMNPPPPPENSLELGLRVSFFFPTGAPPTPFPSSSTRASVEDEEWGVSSWAVSPEASALLDKEGEEEEVG
jgi:hypothetical protein